MLRSRDLLYVNAYLVDRAYGGGEEGGWWYDTGEPLASVPVLLLDLYTQEIDEDGSEEPWFDPDLLTEGNAKIIDGVKAELRRALESYDDPRGLGSVLSRGVVRLRVEFDFARPWPSHTPRYE